MTLPAFNYAQPIVDERGYPSKAFQAWMAAVLATLTAQAGPWVPASRNVVTSGGLKGGGSLSDDVAVVLYRVVTGVASLPTTGNAAGDLAYAIDGRKPGEGVGAGTGVPCFWSGSGWFAVTSGAVVTN